MPVVMQHASAANGTVPNLTFWGLVASPFQLKMQALADAAGLRWQRWPEQAGTLQAVATYRRLAKARRQKAVERFPQRIPGLDEYPAVPYYSFDARQFYYDSTGLALHLDTLQIALEPLVPLDAPLRFICRLIDEAFDEFGLYMAHHNRWVTSAATNTMGELSVQELRKLVPPLLRGRSARKLAERQVRRCPYLFSVAPVGYDNGMRASLRPPSRAGFPATHELLDTAWRFYLAAMETALSRRPFLLGDRFTLADASAYGQLAMNLVDGRAAELLEELAPVTHHWLRMIGDGAHRDSTGELGLVDELRPLLDCIADTFIPLMRDNEAAYREATERGQRRFNEAAFDRGEALYDGTLLGRPYRAVVKTFQVAVWRALCAQWRSMDRFERNEIETRFPQFQDSLFDA